MKTIEQKKLEVQLKQADAAIADLECRIMEREEDILRMQEHIKIQEQKKLEILQSLEEN